MLVGLVIFGFRTSSDAWGSVHDALDAIQPRLRKKRFEVLSVPSDLDEKTSDVLISAFCGGDAFSEGTP